MRRPSRIQISVDNSPGFKSLLSNADIDLEKLQIELIKTDEINKNSNAVIDKGCQELEEELKRLEPEGNKINSATLKLAILNLNEKPRRRVNISAFELNTSRDQNTGENMNLSDETMRDDQLRKRKDKTAPNDEAILVGDTVTIKNKSDKHKAKEMFLVTGKDTEHISIQKVLHPLNNKPMKLMSKVYKTKQKHLNTIHRPQLPISEELDSDENQTDPADVIKVPRWNPINQRFYQSDSEDDELEENAKNVVLPKVGDDDEQNIETDDEAIPENEAEVSDESSNNEVDLQWDSSPEQFALIDNNSLEEPVDNALQPRQLFESDDADKSDDEVEDTDDQVEYDDDDFTSDTDDEEVFNRDEFYTPEQNPRLKRSNAFRKKKAQQSLSEPRVTRQMLNSSDFRVSLSNPSSPSEVTLNRPQLLNRVLNPRLPLVAEAVNLGPAAQRLHHALEPVQPARQSARNRSKAKLDYLELHRKGRRN